MLASFATLSLRRVQRSRDMGRGGGVPGGRRGGDLGVIERNRRRPPRYADEIATCRARRPVCALDYGPASPDDPALETGSSSEAARSWRILAHDALAAPRRVDSGAAPRGTAKAAGPRWPRSGRSSRPARSAKPAMKGLHPSRSRSRRRPNASSSTTRRTVANGHGSIVLNRASRRDRAFRRRSTAPRVGCGPACCRPQVLDKSERRARSRLAWRRSRSPLRPRPTSWSRSRRHGYARRRTGGAPWCCRVTIRSVPQVARWRTLPRYRRVDRSKRSARPRSAVLVTDANRPRVREAFRKLRRSPTRPSASTFAVPIVS